MTELIQNQELTDEEGVQVTAALDGAACHAPTLCASSSTLQSTDSSDEVETRWSLRGVTNGDPADRVESPPAEDANENKAQRYEVCTPDTPVALPLEPDSETGALHTQIKRMIAGRTRPPGQCQRPGCVLGDLDLVSRGLCNISMSCDQRPCP
jgi:hypothetical protein